MTEQEAIALVDEIMSDEKNVETLRKALIAAFNQDPVEFFKTVTMPLYHPDVCYPESYPGTPAYEYEMNQLKSGETL